MYYKRTDKVFQVLAVVVDDIILASSSQSATDEFATSLKRTYAITDLGLPSRLVSLNIKVHSDRLTLDQNQFVKDLAAKFKQSSCKPVPSPKALGQVPECTSPLLPPGNRYLLGIWYI